jgi:hypothetical protein
MATVVLTAPSSIHKGRPCPTSTELNLPHDLPPPTKCELPKPPRTAGRYDPCCPSIAGWAPLPRKTGDCFSHWRLAQRVSNAGSRVSHQVDVPDSDGTSIWRSRDVESYVHDPAAVPVHFARERRCAQATSSCSVVFEPEPWAEPDGASVDREIQSNARASKSSTTGCLRNRDWGCHPPYILFGNCHLLASRSLAEVTMTVILGSSRKCQRKHTVDRLNPQPA